MFFGQIHGLGKMELAEELAPLVEGEEWVAGSDGEVIETPPTFGETEDEIDPASGLKEFEHHEETGVGEDIPDVGEGIGEILSGVKDLGSDDEIEAVRGETLSDGIFFDIEKLVFQEGEVGELLFPFVEEMVGEVGEDVLGAIGGQVG